MTFDESSVVHRVAASSTFGSLISRLVKIIRKGYKEDDEGGEKGGAEGQTEEKEMTRVTLHSHSDHLKSLRSSYTVVYPQKERSYPSCSKRRSVRQKSFWIETGGGTPSFSAVLPIGNPAHSCYSSYTSILGDI